MPILLCNQARTELARSFYRDIVNENDFFYFYVSRTQVWSDEENVETPVDSTSYINESRKNVLMMRRITPSDVVLMANRYDWVSGTVYDHYDDKYGQYIDPADPTQGVYAAASGATSLRDAVFYVMNSEYCVYKCLDNANNSPSTVMPTGTDTLVLQTADDYVWKFLFRVETADRNKFMTPDYIPVRKMSGVGIPLYDINGLIDGLTVADGGSGYTTAPVVVIHGDGVGATATATTDGDAITDITITNAGSGYSFAYVTLEDTDGTGAVIDVTLGALDSTTPQQDVEAAAVSGTVDRVDIVNTGIDYIAGDVIITIDGDGTGAEATATVDVDGKITAITMTDVGSNYTYADVIIQNNIGIGTGAVARAIVSPLYGHGGNAQREIFADKVCVSINLDNETSDYFYNNDFRQLGIIKNITVYESTEYFTDLTGTTLHKITVPSDEIGYYNPDDIVHTDSGGKFVVVDVDIYTNTVSLLSHIDILATSSIITNITTGDTGLTINSIIEPDVDPKEGTILYIDNRAYIVRQQDQVEKVRTILQF